MEENKSLFSLQIDPVSKSHLSSVSGWARFLSIMGMLLLAVGLAATIMTFVFWQQRFGTDVMDRGIANIRLTSMIGSILVMVACFFPLLFLLQFSTRLKRALAGNDQQEINEAFLLLKKYFRYLGLLLLVAIVLYVLAFIFNVGFSTAAL
jgi:uncharacterized membrane protein YidH (DUF202 family)